MIEACGPRGRTQSLGEEIANSVSHGVGLLAALAGMPVLTCSAAQRGDLAAVVGSSVCAGTMVLMYLASTLYHGLPGKRSKRVFQVLDHSAIYLLIAGTYTPFTLGVLHGTWGWALLGAVWGLACVGVVLKATGGLRHGALPTCVYLGMGWLVVIAAKPLFLGMSQWGLFWLLAGGLAYTAGVAFFAAECVRYSHFVWHLFVIAGTACHFVAVLRYAA